MSVEPPVPVDPKPNKAIIAALLVIAIVVRDWIDTNSFDFSHEGLETIIGAVGVLLVFLQSNFKRLFHLG